jgi:hypothetical protein
VALGLAVLAVGYPDEVLDTDDTSQEELFSTSLAFLTAPRVPLPAALPAVDPTVLRPEPSPAWAAIGRPRLLSARASSNNNTHRPVLPRAHLQLPADPAVADLA